MVIAALVLIAQIFDPEIGRWHEPAIRELLGRYTNAYNAQKPGELAALYRPDGQLLPPNSGAVRGREEIETFWRRYLRFYRGGRVSFETDELKVGGKVAWVVGRLRNGPSSGKFVICLERDEGGTWLIAADIWNESGPHGFQPLH